MLIGGGRISTICLAVLTHYRGLIERDGQIAEATTMPRSAFSNKCGRAITMSKLYLFLRLFLLAVFLSRCLQLYVF